MKSFSGQSYDSFYEFHNHPLGTLDSESEFQSGSVSIRSQPNFRVNSADQSGSLKIFI